MPSFIMSLAVPLVFFSFIVLGWIAIQLIAAHRLGERKQGCKGPIRSDSGEMLCCKGDGRKCEEAEHHAHS